jgi:hypothetical protein
LEQVQKSRKTNQNTKTLETAQPLLDVILASKKVADLPSDLKTFFSKIHEGISPRILEELNNPHKLHKANNIYTLAPRKYIYITITHNSSDSSKAFSPSQILLKLLMA